MASEQLMVHSEETEAVVAEGLQVQPDCALASLHVEACTLPAYTAPSPRKCTKFNNSFGRKKERHRSAFNCPYYV